MSALCLYYGLEALCTVNEINLEVIVLIFIRSISPQSESMFGRYNVLRISSFHIYFTSVWKQNTVIQIYKHNPGILCPNVAKQRETSNGWKYFKRWSFSSHYPWNIAFFQELAPNPNGWACMIWQDWSKSKFRLSMYTQQSTQWKATARRKE